MLATKHTKGRERQYDEWLGQNELRFTTYWFMMIHLNNNWEQAIVPFTSSQLRVSRKLTADINRFTYEDESLKSVKPPLYAQSWELDTILETSKNGDDYYNYSVSNPTTLDLEKDEEVLTLANKTYTDAANTPVLQTEDTPQLVSSETTVNPF